MITLEKILIRYKFLFILIGCLLPLLRFNSNHLIFKQQSYDQKYFAGYVNYFRGEPSSVPLKPATNWRFLLPAIAATLPFGANTSLNIINYLSFLLTVFILYRFLNSSDSKHTLIILFLYAFSFPTLYYTCIGYADTTAILFVTLSIIALLSNKLWLFYLSFLLGLFTKETSVIMVAYFLGLRFKVEPKLTLVHTTILLIIFLSFGFLVRELAPVTAGYTNDTFWTINKGAITTNLTRFNTWFSFLATALSLSLMLWVQPKLTLSPVTIALIAVTLAVTLLWVFSFTTTIADGRLWWHLFPVYAAAGLKIRTT